MTRPLTAVKKNGPSQQNDPAKAVDPGSATTSTAEGAGAVNPASNDTETSGQTQPPQLTAGPSVEQSGGREGQKEREQQKNGNVKSPEEPELVAPHLAVDRLSAVVKPLTTAISSRGFQNTLSVASNLAHIDGAREVISDSFKRSAEAASQTLMADLDKLLEALPPPKSKSKSEEDEEMQSVEGAASQSGTGTATPIAGGAPAVAGGVDRLRSLDSTSAGKAQSPALASLASPSSAQAVFLRSLRALDYLLTGK